MNWKWREPIMAGYNAASRFCATKYNYPKWPRVKRFHIIQVCCVQVCHQQSGVQCNIINLSLASGFRTLAKISWFYLVLLAIKSSIAKNEINHRYLHFPSIRISFVLFCDLIRVLSSINETWTRDIWERERWIVMSKPRSTKYPESCCSRPGGGGWWCQMGGAAATF